MCGQIKKKLFSSIRPRRVRIYFLLRTSKFIHIYVYTLVYSFFSSSSHVFSSLSCMLMYQRGDFFCQSTKKIQQLLKIIRSMIGEKTRFN
jgi:hypothetical protein